MLNSGIPKEDVGEGLLITMDPISEMDGKPLGEGYCKVLVEKADKPTDLERPHLNLLTVGDAVGRYVAWRYSDVNFIRFFFSVFNLIVALYNLSSKIFEFLFQVIEKEMGD